jgi:hypothetical protein
LQPLDHATFLGALSGPNILFGRSTQPERLHLAHRQFYDSGLKQRLVNFYRISGGQRWARPTGRAGGQEGRPGEAGNAGAVACRANHRRNKLVFDSTVSEKTDHVGRLTLNKGSLF